MFTVSHIERVVFFCRRVGEGLLVLLQESPPSFFVFPVKLFELYSSVPRSLSSSVSFCTQNGWVFFVLFLHPSKVFFIWKLVLPSHCIASLAGVLSQFSSLLESHC